MAISKMKEREEAARLFEAYRDADEAYEAAVPMNDPVYAAAIEALDKETEAREVALARERDQRAGITALAEAAKATLDALDQYPEKVMTTFDMDDGEIIMRCTRTDVPLLESDGDNLRPGEDDSYSLVEEAA